jgi:F-type H+-transporting ATPase subunit beta
VGNRHYDIAREVRRTLANYEELKDIIAMLGLEELSREDRKIVFRARRLERYLTQPFFTTEQYTGLEGKLVEIDETIEGCERILHDEFSEHDESALYMIGPIGEAKQKGKVQKRVDKEQPTESTDENKKEKTSEPEQDNRHKKKKKKSESKDRQVKKT